MFKTITSCNVSLCIAEKMNDVSLSLFILAIVLVCCVQLRFVFKYICM